jgi:hypothetical protein
MNGTGASTTTTAAAGDAKATSTATAQTSATKDATTTAKADGAKSMLDGADQQTADTKTADTNATDTKTGAEGDKKTDAATDAKAAQVIDEKWEPKAIEGVTRDPKVVAEARSLLLEAQGLTPSRRRRSSTSATRRRPSPRRPRPRARGAEGRRRAEHFKALESDKELGGAKLEATKADYHRAIRALGGKELAEALKSEGLENWPPLVKALTKAGRALAEDTVTDTTKDGGKAVGDPFTRHLRAAYPRMFNKES